MQVSKIFIDGIDREKKNLPQRGKRVLSSNTLLLMERRQLRENPTKLEEMKQCRKDIRDYNTRRYKQLKTIAVEEFSKEKLPQGENILVN